MIQLKKTLFGTLLAGFLLAVVASPALAANQSYRFYYYEDRDNSGHLNIGDDCWRGSTLSLGTPVVILGTPNYIWSYVPLAPAPTFIITNTTQLNDCKMNSSATRTVVVGTQYKLKDIYGAYLFFTPAGGGTQYLGLIGGNQNF